MLKKIVQNGFLLIISVLIALIIGELFARILFKDKINLFPKYHTDAHYGSFSLRSIIPNMEFTHTSIVGTFFFKTNNRGFRNNNNIEYNKAPDEIRILCLGDSQTQGYEVNQDQTFSYIAELLLNKQGMRWTVINAGVAGFGTAEQLLFLENEGYKYSPDVVVVGFSANDFEDNIKSGFFGLENDSLVIKKYEHLPGVNIQNFIYKYKLFKFLGENSYLYTYTFFVVWEYYKRQMTAKSKYDITTHYAIRTQEHYSEYEKNLTRNILSRMYSFCRQRNIHLIIIDIPECDMRSAIPTDMLCDFRDCSDALFYSQDMLLDYKKLNTTHVPHGQRHISSETHQLFGKKIAEYVIKHNNLKSFSGK